MHRTSRKADLAARCVPFWASFLYIGKRSKRAYPEWGISPNPPQARLQKFWMHPSSERPLVAEKGQRKIVVEIKVFTTPSPMTDLEKAVGQYGIYRTFLKRLQLERELYLAIARDVYQDFFSKPAVQDIVADHQIWLLVFDPETEEIVKWIS
ncbi:MAG: element excision factor XisH family protein [Caldilineaceae bacterium]